MKGNPRQSGILDSTVWTPDSNRYSGNPDSLTCIPDSKAQDPDSIRKISRDSRFQKQLFPRFLNPDSLTWGEKEAKGG